MYMPSSPPSLPEEVFNEPPSSPPLPPATFPSRKRHADYESSLSSDPIFSEDASEESDLNGVFKKKKYTKGPWYNHAPSHLRPSSVASSPLNKDSGVWMGSDSSTDSIGGCNRRVQTLSFKEYSVKRAPAIAPPAKAQSPQEIAAQMVFKFVDACQQSIDLSEMRLKVIPNEVLRPLHQLIRLPVELNDSQKITPEQFAPLTPEIKLFLAKNELVSLPPELWNLGNITVLSLRNNELTELPPSVARLRNLRELNIAGNQLEWLPWELLHLVLPQNRKLLRISLSPNPFLQPTGRSPPPTLSRLRIPSSAEECAKSIRKIRARFPLATKSDFAYEALFLRLLETRLHQAFCNTQTAQPETPEDPRPIYVASSKTTFLDFDGSILRSPMISISPRSGPDHTASLTPNSLPARNTSSAPSLFELSARICSRSPYIHQLPSLLPEDASPPVVGALRKVMESKELGMQACSVCRKHYIIPRARWIEFWFDGHGSGEQFLPFNRQACSWRCVQRLREERDDEIHACKNSVAQVEASTSFDIDGDIYES